MFVIHLGASGFPSGYAQMQRILLTFKAIKNAGFNPLIINKHSHYKVNGTKRLWRFQGIPYIFTSLSVSRPDSFLGRNLNKFSGYIGELFFLIKNRKSIKAAIYYDASFANLVYYRFLSKVLRFKLIIQYVEFRSSVQEGQSVLTKLKDKMFDNYCFYFCDGIIVISEFLKNRSISINKKLPLLKIPAICDFTTFSRSQQKPHGNYLMYCGTVGYYPVIFFIIDLFNKLKAMNLYNGKLLFAIGVGDNQSGDYAKVVQKIGESSYSGSIIVKKNVFHKDLIDMYLTAEMLIVPLRPVMQDIAGFHHKIGEYTAAGKPIISTKLGELECYFQDGVSAILANEYTIDSYVSKLSEVITSSDRLQTIGNEGYKVGNHYLNYITYAAQLKQFIETI
jgi:glycosyltransferase involved in cell wall biosynthesis